jgi:hypothetical protein
MYAENGLQYPRRLAGVGQQMERVVIAPAVQLT